MIEIIMISDVIKIGTDQIVGLGEVKLVDRIEVDQGMSKIIGMIIGEESLDVT